MLRSMFAGVSGSRAHQVWMDVIGDNIANINTPGYKAGRVTFHELLVQTIRGGGAPVKGGRGGINPMQVGLGTSLRSIDTWHTQGNIQVTEVPSDLAIDGIGFFVLSDGLKTYFSRDGSFQIGADGVLVSPATGYRVQGKPVDPATGDIDSTQPPADIKILIGQVMEAAATRNAILRGNLDSQADPYDPVTGTGGKFSGLLQVYDSLGLLHKLPITFEKLDPNTDPATGLPGDPNNSADDIGERAWKWEVTDPLASPTQNPVGEGYLIFTENGKFDPAATGAACAAYNAAHPGAEYDYPPKFDIVPTDGSAQQSVNLDLESLTQYAEPSSVSMSFQDGFPAGTLETFAVDADGVITGIYSNGQYRTLAQVVLANFSNPGGLLRMGGGFYQVSPNSGAPIIGEPMKDGKGKIIGGAIEMSNVDLAKQFTDMIISQRGFQANSRVITTADEMLQDLLSLKR
ncbi:MAG: flagellar hook protein FlgE [Bacillota bacterium]|nr:flagellar hook protein FlgE [Bacillota bacterium]